MQREIIIVIIKSVIVSATLFVVIVSCFFIFCVMFVTCLLDLELYVDGKDFEGEKICHSLNGISK